MRMFLLVMSVSGVLMACRGEIPTRITGTKSEIHEKSVQRVREDLKARGYQTFVYVDEDTGDTVLMQQNL